jgi:hypothetical protein
MPKKFYTERDIEDMASQGIMTLELNDDVVLTDLAYEKAGKLGVKLIEVNQQIPSAPVRPYISTQSMVSRKHDNRASSQVDDLKNKVRSAVFAKLGDKVDPVLIDTIIDRVLKNINFPS